MNSKTAAALLIGLFVPLAALATDPDLGCRIVDTQQKTVMVTYVKPGGLASQMGLKADDVMFTINGQVIPSSQVAMKTLTALRGEYDISIRRPATDPLSKSSKMANVRLRGELKESDKKAGDFYVIPNRNAK